MKPHTQARVFAVTQQEADAAPEVVTGTMSVFDRNAYILIDPGATHSFISVEFAANASIAPQLLDGAVVVSLPTGDSIVAETVYKSSKISIESQEFMADLIVLAISEFDVILGMDWLSKYRASVDCFRKEVRLCSPSGTEVIFRGVRKSLFASMVSVMKARKMF